MRITRMRTLAVATAALAAAGIAGAALAVGGEAAAAAEAEDVIQACRHPNGGWVRIVAEASSCRAKEQAVSWNVAGPAGEPGPAGPPGPKGDPGAGLTKLGDLAGIDCTAESGEAGKVELDFAGDDTVLFRCVTGGAPPPPPPPPPGEGTSLVVNEIDYDQVGTDGDGFVEIANTGDEAADLSGLALVFVDGADSSEYRREALTGTLAAGGYLVVDFDAQNGAPDGVALVDTEPAALLDALSYEGPITDAVIGGATYSLVEGRMLPETVADSNAVAGSLSRIPDGTDTDDAEADWRFTTTATRAAANVLTSP
ncbi:MAG TPA: lamin tail domain-containing protein [Gaiellaceae bacterium]|nr:lamin tail domain-containing protein [Gaiellaceae bacterium]